VKLRNKRNVRLVVEQLEDRRVPTDWVSYSPALLTVGSMDDTAYAGAPGYQFQLQAEIWTTSDTYESPDLRPQAVTSLAGIPVNGEPVFRSFLYSRSSFSRGVGSVDRELRESRLGVSSATLGRQFTDRQGCRSGGT
jgi:hypothetical protein